MVGTKPKVVEANDGQGMHMAAEVCGWYNLPETNGGHQRQMVGSGGDWQMRVVGARGKG